MKVYIVISQALHHDSSYYDVVGVWVNRKDAEAQVECDHHDVCLGIDRGDFGEDFDHIETNENLFPIDPESWDMYIVSTKGYYVAWRIEEWEVE